MKSGKLEYSDKRILLTDVYTQRNQLLNICVYVCTNLLEATLDHLMKPFPVNGFPLLVVVKHPKRKSEMATFLFNCL